jgi:hypothetical protein
MVAIAVAAIATGGLVVMLQLVFSFFFLEEDEDAKSCFLCPCNPQKVRLATGSLQWEQYRNLMPALLHLECEHTKSAPC